MRDQEIIGLWEAYQQVHTQEEVEHIDEITRSMGRRAKKYREDQAQAAHMAAVQQHQDNMKNNPEYRERHERLRQTHSRREDQKESFDLFDYLLEYLVAEGYADTNKAALAIMANMSEEWKQSIVEQLDPDSTGGTYADFVNLHKIEGKIRNMSPEEKKKYFDNLPRVGPDGKRLKGA